VCAHFGRKLQKIFPLPSNSSEPENVLILIRMSSSSYERSKQSSTSLPLLETGERLGKSKAYPRPRRAPRIEICDRGQLEELTAGDERLD
jgi:hypothetical protein